MRDFSLDKLNNIATQERASINPTNLTSLDLAKAIAAAAEDKKAADIVLLKVTDISYLSDYFVVITGFSKTQTKAISESIEDRIEARFAKSPVRVSGKQDGAWIVLDYGDVIVHIFLPDEREYYNLEAFWGHAERIEFMNPS